MSPAVEKMLSQNMASAQHTPATVKWEDSDLNLGARGLLAYVVPLKWCPPHVLAGLWSSATSDVPLCPDGPHPSQGEKLSKVPTRGLLVVISTCEAPGNQSFVPGPRVQGGRG